MGKFPALLPADLRYARNHMWCRRVEARQRFGFTAYAVRLMQDVYFLDWHISAGDAVKKLQEIGHIETSKAVADLFAPITGVVIEFNRELLNDPSPINVENYTAGWLFEMEATADDTLTVEEYYQFLDQNWEKTQQSLKGHM
ncbi:MAG TPA: glycine cleavage system protein H [Gemmataceae bacterium]|jgi:glycine cleavage system H protein|nr:glycine cleavage system protein H [Gemmataceae bacterium]